MERDKYHIWLHIVLENIRPKIYFHLRKQEKGENLIQSKQIKIGINVEKMKLKMNE